MYDRAIADGMDAEMLPSVRTVVEQYEDGFVAYPLGITGAVVGEPPVLDAFVVEDAVPIT